MELLQVSKRKHNVEQQLQSMGKIKEDKDLLKQKEGGFEILGSEKTSR
jgi:hypothetical protein